MKNVLRWIAVLPAAIIASSIGCIALMILMLFGDFLSGDLWLHFRHPQIISASHFFTSFVIFAVFGYLFVYAGTATAPQYKKETAFVLFGVIAIVLGVLLIVCLFFSKITESWRMIVNAIICIATAGVTALNTEEEYQSDNPQKLS